MLAATTAKTTRYIPTVNYGALKPRADGLLFSVKQQHPISSLSWAICAYKQRCPVVFTHVELLIGTWVYSANILHGTDSTLFNHISVTYEVFMLVPELHNVNFAELSLLLDTDYRICTRLVADVMALAGVDMPRDLTPDEIYAWLTV